MTATLPTLTVRPFEAADHAALEALWGVVFADDPPVAPEHRRRRIATRLVRAAESGLRERGCPKVNLEVRASNVEVVAFCESLGFSVEERTSMGRRLDGAG